MTNFICTECDKEFTTKQSLQYHIKKGVCKKNHDFECDFCGKILSSAPSLSRHRSKSCKERKRIKDRELFADEMRNKELFIQEFGNNGQYNPKLDKIYDMLVKMKEENAELKDQTMQIKRDNENLRSEFSKKDMITNKQSQNINFSNVNNGNVNNGTVNNTVNNIYLSGYGKEDMSRIDKNDLIKVFKSGFNSALTLTELMHFNPKYPEFHNVYISSMKNKYAMMYNGHDWTLVMKDELIDKIYDNKRNYIEENLEDFVNSLSKSQLDALHRWLDSDDDHSYIKKVKNNIRLLLYNQRNLALNNTCLIGGSNECDDLLREPKRISSKSDASRSTNNKRNMKVIKEPKITEYIDDSETSDINKSESSEDSDNSFSEKTLQLKREEFKQPATRLGTKRKSITDIKAATKDMNVETIDDENTHTVKDKSNMKVIKEPKVHIRYDLDSDSDFDSFDNIDRQVMIRRREKSFAQRAGRPGTKRKSRKISSPHDNTIMTT